MLHLPRWEQQHQWVCGWAFQKGSVHWSQTAFLEVRQPAVRMTRILLKQRLEKQCFKNPITLYQWGRDQNWIWRCQQLSCGIKTFSPVPGQASSVVGARISFQQDRALSAQGVASRDPPWWDVGMCSSPALWCSGVSPVRTQPMECGNHEKHFLTRCFKANLLEYCCLFSSLWWVGW